MASLDFLDQNIRLQLANDKEFRSKFNNLLNDVARGVEGKKEELAKLLKVDFESKFVLKTDLDARGAKRAFLELEKDFKGLDKLAREVSRDFKLDPGSITSLKGQLREATQQRDQIKKLEKAVVGYGLAVDRISPRWDAQNQKVEEIRRKLREASASNALERAFAAVDLRGFERAGKELTNIVNIFQSLSIVIGQITRPINESLSALNRLQQLGLVFQGIGQGVVGSTKALSESTRIALGLGVELNTVRDGFQQLSPVILRSGGDIEDVSKVTEALSSRFVVFGLSADKQRRVMNGVIQAFSKGKLMAEELTQQISEADPAFKTDLARALRVSTGELEKMVQAGKLTNDVLVQVLPELSKSSILFGKLGTSAGSAVDALLSGSATIDQVRTQISNLNQINLENLAKLFEPALFAFLSIQATVVDVITEIRKLEVFDTIANSLNGFIVVTGKAVELLLNLAIAIGKVTDPIFGAINAFDELLPKFGEVRASGLILTTLIGTSLFGAIRAVLPAIKALVVANGSLAISAAAGAGNALKGLIGSIVNLSRASVVFLGDLTRTIAANAGLASSNALVARSYDAVAASKARAAAAGKGAVIGQGAETIAALLPPDFLKNTKSLETLGQTARGIRGPLAVVGVTLLTIGANMFVLKKQTDLADESNKNFAESMKRITANLKEALTQFEKKDEVEAFAAELQKIEPPKALEDKNLFESAFDQIENLSKGLGQFNPLAIRFNNFMNQSNAVVESTAKKMNGLSGRLKETTKAIEEYNKAQDEDGLRGEQLTIYANAVIDTLRLVRDEATKSRDALLKDFKSGKFEGVEFEKAKQQLLAINAQIGLVDAQITSLARTAQRRGIELNVKINTNVKEVILTDLATLDERIKNLKGIKEKEIELRAIETLKKTISRDPIEIRYQVDDVALKAATQTLQAQVKIADLLTQKAKARAGVEQSIFGVLSARQNNVISSLEEELERRKRINSEIDEGSRAGTKLDTLGIERRIANERQKAALIEDGAARNKIKSLLEQQDLERTLIDFKQQQSLLDAVIARNGAQRLLLEQRIAEQLAIINLIKAERSGDENQIRAAFSILRLQMDSTDIAQRSVQLEDQKIKSLLAQNKLEKEILGYKQQSERNNLLSESSVQNLISRDRELANSIDRRIDGVARFNAELNQSGRQNFARRLAAGFDQVDGSANQIANEIKNVQTEFNAAGGEVQEITNNFDLLTNAIGKTNDKLFNLRDTLSSLDGEQFEANIRITSSGFFSNRWSGGPVSAGQTYQVNELGKEAFLSSSGHLSMINRPKNALWRPTTSGTVIPAHIAAGLDIPSGGIKTSSRTASGAFRGASGANNPASIGRVILGALQSAGIIENNHNLAVTQAAQASQIGKLTQAVNRLVDKDWNVKVNVKQPGLSGYVDTINRML